MVNDMKLQEIFVELINKQMEPYNKKYEDLKSEEEWYSKYTTTESQEEEFRKWAIDLLRRKGKMTKKRAQKEVDWFILGYGLRTEN